ncbi:MAG: CPBP family intramembrane metalloprotease [Chitinophagaceae bacterium]|nr:MAG: CPBP family intramembrane metalloprotease [Chitinophagaceae bacterium]
MSVNFRILEMQKFNFKFFLIIFILGLAGVASLLLSDLDLAGMAVELPEEISPELLRFLVLINPFLLVLAASLVGTLLHQKVNLHAPVLKSLVTKKQSDFNVKNIVVKGLLGGFVAAILILIINTLFTPFISEKLIHADERFNLHFLTKILYGGVSEEIIARFGVMTFLVWLWSKITESLANPVYWTAILLSALVFALGHLPAAFQLDESLSMMSVIYLITGNMAGGIIFGYLYWKNGLESAIIAHAFTHVVLQLVL